MIVVVCSAFVVPPGISRGYAHSIQLHEMNSAQIFFSMRCRLNLECNEKSYKGKQGKDGTESKHMDPNDGWVCFHNSVPPNQVPSHGTANHLVSELILMR